MSFHDSVFGMQHVNSRNHVGEWRSPGVLSEGASEALVKKKLELHGGNLSTRKNMDEDLDRSFVCCLIEDLMWCISSMNEPKKGSDATNNTDKTKAASMTTPTVTLQQAEDWAIFLHSILTHDTRAFHGIAHVFKIGAGASPIQLLAAFFRDVISHYIDGLKLSKREEDLLSGLFDETDGSRMVLSASLCDPRDLIITKIFGYELGMDLSSRKKHHGGLDIFLSTILASRLLKDCLQPSHVAQLASCLEGTIPFRSVDSEGRTPLDVLHTRLVECNETFALGLTDAEIELTLQEAADLNNRVLGNMASNDLAEFLNHTWQLLPEQHGALRQHALYTLTDYYQAIQNMVQIVGQLQPERVFVSYHGLPSDREVQRFHNRLSSNLTTARMYLRARLLSVAIISALAVLTGGDSAPKSFFFGDLPTPQRETTALGKPLVDEQWDESTDGDLVYQILCGRGMRPTGFDTAHAPLAAYLYKTLGDERISLALAECSAPMTSSHAWTLLKGLPTDLVKTVTTELSRVAVSRKRRIDRFWAEYQMKGF